MNRDGSVVRYLALAHNERHPRTGSPVAKVIHNFGRADKVDREALARLVASISRFLEPEQAGAAAAGAEVENVAFRRPVGRWRSSTPVGWAGRGRWIGSGSASASGRRSAARPRAVGWTATRSSGWSSRWSRSGRWS